MRYMLTSPIPGLDGGLDKLFKNAVEVVVQYDRASASLLQRRLDIGYARAARLIDQLEVTGVIGPAEGSKPREVFIHSSEELLGEKGKESSQKKEDPFEVPENYRVPSDIKLSKTDKTPWGIPFSDAFNTGDFKDSKAEFPLHLGFDNEDKLYTESLFDVKNLIITCNPPSQLVLSSIFFAFVL